jgi:cytochrome c biogenesis protein CcdA
MPSFSLSEKHQKSLAGSGIWGAFALGFIFALVFCPIAAALFFGSLIPLALSHPAGVVLPFVYGVGTGLPVLFFAVVITLGVISLNHWFKRLARLEFYMRKVTGGVFVIVGIYYVLVYVLKLI